MDFEFEVLPVLIVLVCVLAAWLAVWRMRSLGKKELPDLRKVLEGVALVVILVVALGVGASSGINAVLLHHFKAHEMPGQLYTVNGHAMRMECMGSGEPTLVLDAGLGNDGLIWGGVQPVLAKTTRVCSYDRAGFGWSETLAPPRDADHIAEELHGLLAAAQVDGPVVLMGHSIAGIYIRDYATRYPTQVAGLIFVDGSTPLQMRNPAFSALNRQGPPLWLAMLLSKGALAVGMPRLFGGCTRGFPGFDAERAKLQAQDQCMAHIDAIQKETDSIDQSGEEAVHSGPYGDLPILIFSQDPAVEAAQPRMSAVAQAWNQMQEDLKKLSTRSRRIIANGSGHYVQLKRAGLIEKEVPVFIDEVRGKAPQRTDYGTTVKQ